MGTRLQGATARLGTTVPLWRGACVHVDCAVVLFVCVTSMGNAQPVAVKVMTDLQSST